MYSAFALLYCLVFLVFYSSTIQVFLVPKIVLFLLLNSLFAAYLVIKNEKIQVNKAILLTLVGFGGISVIKLLFGDDFWLNFTGNYPNHLGLWLVFNFLILFGLGNYFYNKKEKDEIVAETIMVMLALVGIIGILQYFDLNFIVIEDAGLLERAYSTLGSPNGFGFLMTTGFLLSIFAKKWLKSLSIIFLLGLIFSGSRAAMLSLAIGLGTIGVMSKNRKLQIGSTLFGLVGVALLFLNLRSIYSRIYIWEASLETFLNNPVGFFIGNDFASLQVKIYQFLNIEYFKYEPLINLIDSPHNIFIEVLYQFGLIGLGAVLYWIYLLCKKFKNDQVKLAFLSAVITFMFFNNIFIEVAIVSALILSQFKNSKSEVAFVPHRVLLTAIIAVNIAISFFYVIHDRNHYAFRENLLIPTTSFSYVLKNMSLAPFYEINQNYIVKFDLENAFNNSDYNYYLNKNFLFKLKYASNEKLLEILKTNQELFYPSQILGLAEELKNRGMNQELAELKKQFKSKYPKDIDPASPDGVDKANMFFVGKLKE